METIFSQHGRGIERTAIAGTPPGISSPTAGVPLLKSTLSWLTYSALIGIGALNGFRNRLALLTGTPLDVLFEDVPGYRIDLVGIRTSFIRHFKSSLFSVGIVNDKLPSAEAIVQRLR